MNKLGLLVCLISLSAATARAQMNWTWYDGSPIDVAYSTGSGANASLLIVDYQDGNHFAFEYLWDAGPQPPTGWGMIQALGVQMGSPNPSAKLEYAYTDWGWGIMVDGFGYDGNLRMAGADAPWPSWVYYVSDGGDRFFSGTAPMGATDRQLFDGSWDGWSWHANGWGTGAPPVPEPATMLLLALGGVLMVHKQRRLG